MEQTPNFVDQIIRKYEEKEQLLEQRLMEITQQEHAMESSQLDRDMIPTKESSQTNQSKLASAKKRNADMIKEIEMARAKMRSLALYSPLEHVLQKSIDDYLKAIRPKNASK